MKFLPIFSLLVLILTSSLTHAYEADFGFKFEKLPSKSATEFRAVWWNILQGGKLSKEIERKTGTNPLQNNLDSLTQPKDKPEFLILGEYRPDRMKPEIDEMLRSRYRYSIFVPYSSTYPEQGILVLTDLETKLFTQLIGWSNPSASMASQKAYRTEWEKIYPASKTSFDRSFIALQYEWKGEIRYLLPFHAVQPWMPIKATYPEKIAKVMLAAEILLGTTNPLFYQLREYLTVMKTICTGKEKILMMGDLNTPDSMLGFKPVGYQLLTHFFKDAFQRGETYTFPAPSSIGSGLEPSKEKIDKIKIDHALVSGSVKTKDAIRLPLRGSDHFPIMVTITN